MEPDLEMEKDRGVFPEYEDDIFISYAHIDNRPLEQGHQGWVDCMHITLARRLGEVLGVEPKIWRDPKLRAHDAWDSIVMKLENVAIMVAVLSPRYVRSDSCLKEVQEFYRRARQLGGISRDTKERIFKIVKTPIKTDQPFELKNSRAYRFYETDQTSGKPREFKHESRFETFPKFLDKLDDLVLDIEEFVTAQQTTPSGRLIPLTGRTVYLAETAPDVDSQRDKIKRELQSYGHLVLPERDFPIDPWERTEAIRGDLRRSDLSIHLIGKTYDGTHPPFESLVRLQHKLALERERDPKFGQVVWIPKGLTVNDPDQQKLIEELWQDANTRPGIEMSQDIQEDLKTNVLNRLKKLDHITLRPRPIKATEVDGYLQKDTSNFEGEAERPDPLYIYLINDYQEYEATAELRQFLFDQENVEVFQILAEDQTGDETPDGGKQAEGVLQLQKHFLNDCDAAIIFQGRASDVWRELRLCELRRSVVSRSKELLGKGVYLSGPLTTAKKNFRSNVSTVIRDEAEFPPQELISFIQEIRTRASARKLRVKGVGQ